MNNTEDDYDDHRFKEAWDSIWMDSDASFKYLDHFEIVNFVLDNVKEVCKNPIICDVGGGTGFLLSEIKKKKVC